MAERDNAPEWMDGAVFYEGFDSCIVGYGTQFSRPVVIYNYEKCIAKLVDDFTLDCEMDDHVECEHFSDAEEWMSFNVTGAWVGDNTPIFLMQEGI